MVEKVRAAVKHSGMTWGLRGQNIQIYRVDNEAKIIAFHRWDKQGPKDSVVVVVNMSNQNRDGYIIGFPRAGLWKSALTATRISPTRILPIIPPLTLIP